MAAKSMRTGKRQTRVKTPAILQLEAAECGAISLAIVLAHYGRHVSLERLRAECGVGRDGSRARNIVKAARAHRCAAKGYRYPAEALRQVQYPVILHWESRHFVVLEGVDDDRVYLNDPAAGHRTLDWNAFVNSYTGIALEIRPEADFEPAGEAFKLWRFLWRKCREERGATLFLLAVGIFLAILALSLPILDRLFLDDIVTGQSNAWLPNFCLALAMLFCVEGTLVFLRDACLTNWQLKWTRTESSRFFRHLLRLPIPFFTQRLSGEVASRVTAVGQAARLFGQHAAVAALDALATPLYFALLWQYNATLTLLLLPLTALQLIFFALLRRRTAENRMRLAQERSLAESAALSGIQTIETLKAGGQESVFFAKWTGYRAKAAITHQEIALLDEAALLLPVFFSGFNAALVLAIGGFEIMDSLMTAGTYIAFQRLATRLQEAVDGFAALGGIQQTVAAGLERAEDVLRASPDALCLPDSETGRLSPEAPLTGAIELDNIRFGYSPLETPLLDGFSLRIGAGRRVALVGASGCGKSTVAKIAAGLLAPWEGEVRLDGKPVREIPRAARVHAVAAVDQDIALFSGSIRDNITLFDASTAQRDVDAAAKDACIHEEILRIDGAYNASVEENGRNLSGGQRQRLEIARALARNPSLLLLDEATSALDTLTERDVMDRIRRRGCACLIVAHRLDTVRDADEIVVMESGHIVQHGTHETLSSVQGPYRDLMSGDAGGETK